MSLHNPPARADAAAFGSVFFAPDVFRERNDHRLRRRRRRNDWLSPGSLREPQVRLVVCPRMPKLSMGAKTRALVQQARGGYVAVWDDDDWSSPDRLRSQIEAIRNSKFAACVLSRVMILDRLTGAAYVGETRTWECTMVCRKSDMPAYPDLDRDEDIAVINALKAKDLLGILDAPSHYVYTYHGTNIGSRMHFRRRIFGPATALPLATAKKIALVVTISDAPPISRA